MRDLSGRGAVVTGGASGIGLGIARTLAREGCNIALLDVDAAALERARVEIEALGVRAITHRVDVSDDAAMARAAAAVDAALGRLHVIVNNAGVDIGSAPVAAVAERDWDWLIGVNVYGVLHGIRHFLPRVRCHGEGGHIVITSSAIGFFMVPGLALGPYAMTKYALVGLAEALEDDLAGTNIGVTVLCPGAVDTNIPDAGRNRPERFGGAYQRPEVPGLRATLAGGLSPEAVGERTLRAIRDGEMYAFTDEVPKPAIEARFKRVLEAFDRVKPR